MHCVVNGNGKVMWVPPAQFTVLCALNLKYWPFDQQECEMKFASWTYSGNQIDLQIMNNDTEAHLDLLILNSEWELERTTITRHLQYYACCTDPYPDVTVGIVLSRRSPSYKALIISPAFGALQGGKIFLIRLFVFILDFFSDNNFNVIEFLVATAIR